LKKLIILALASLAFANADAQFFKRKNQPAESKTETKEERKESKEDRKAAKEQRKQEKEQRKDEQKEIKDQKEIEKAAKPKKWSEKEKQSPPLEDVKWVLLDVSGKSIGGRAYIKLSDKGDKLTGHTSCNLISGSFKKGRSNDVKFNTITTKMACDEMKTEANLLSALNGTNLYDLNGQNLLLYHDTILLAIFEANFED
jgi:heat shock protein HslJ